MGGVSRYGYALCVLLVASLSMNLFLLSEGESGSGYRGYVVQGDSGLMQPYLGSAIGPDTAGNRTVQVINRRIFSPSPNNVSAKLVNVTDASDAGLPEFYRIWISVRNPSGQQYTKVYTRKGGHVSFFNLPRYLDDRWRGSSYIR